MIIDVHTHLNNYSEDQVDIHQRLENLQSTMSANKVDYALVLTSYKVNENRPSLKEVIDVTRDCKNLGVVAAVSYLNYKEKDLREISDYLKDGLVKGLKLYPGYEPFYPHDRRLQVVYDLAVEFDVPVMFHSGDTYSPKGKVRFAHPLHIDDVAVDNPDMRIVICHVGNPWIKDCMEVIYKNKNCYADFSGLVLGDFSDHFEQYMKEQLQEMILYAGEPKYLLYGTDWPICNMKSYLSFIRQLGLPEEKNELILWKNAAKLFKIDVEKLASP
ncbi:MAG: amidohydrolase family protein [Cyclobacteriaceae bacterium]